MFRGVYSAATGMQAAARSQEVTAHNVAHGNVHGFRQHGVRHETFADALSGALTGARAAAEFTDFRPGPLQQTGAPYDLALQGDAFFSVQTPAGPVYTRDGAFSRAADGRLLNTAGYALLGAAGPVTVPGNAASVVIAADGSVLADGSPQGRLQLTRFRDTTRLEPAGTALFLATPEAGAQPASGGVLQGYREGSNLLYPTAMALMMRDLRHFEAAGRALRTIADAVALVTRPT